MWDTYRKCVRTMLRRWAISGALVVLVMLGGACESAAPASPSPPPMDKAQELDKLRSLAFAYWEAFNGYDADSVLGYLEESYRQQRDETVREEIGRIKLFRVQLGLSEETPPRLLSDHEGEMFLTMKEPLGTRRIHMAFLKVEGEWKVTFAEESK